MTPLDPLVRKAQADVSLQETAEQLRRLLQEACLELDPFPFFLGSADVRAIEAEPCRAAGPDQGCVVVCPDGILYEFTYTINVGGDASDFSRTESARKLELPPQDYIPYAYNALCEVTRLLRERRKSSA